ncbi:MAG: hypothetical protein ACRC7D_10965 [Aeromonas popoffii]|uniref:hypothetical protein n=1 Tax=Aeromonas popoffii TaxID=70856 RepID=UPI003F3018DF
MGIYFYSFNNGLSTNQNDWGSFGSYLSGTLGAAFAFLAFLAGLENLRYIKNQQLKEELIHTIKSYESNLRNCYGMLVTCEEPWIWGHSLKASGEIKELPLRTLLESDSIDWQYHLAHLSTSLAFRRQPNGELFQDRDIWLMAFSASKGLFIYIELYEKLCGKNPISSYYRNTYEIPYNRLCEAV